MTRHSPLFQRRRVSAGSKGEDLVRFALSRWGFKFICKIQTGFRRVYTKGGYTWKPVTRVAGDFRAIWPEGISALIEVKSCTGKFKWSALRPVQTQSLTEHAQCGGVSFVAVVHDGQVALLSWPIVGFGPRVAMDWVTVREMAAKNGFLFDPRPEPIQ